MNKENIMNIIQSYKDEINQISSELIQIKELKLEVPEVTKAAQLRLGYLHNKKYFYEIKANAWGLIESNSEQVLSEYDM